MKIVRKIFTWLILPVVIVGLGYLIVDSILQPVNFNKETEARSKVAIQRLKDIRTLEEAYKSVNNKYTADIDSLLLFYNTGKMEVLMQVGSADDSASVAHTNAIRKKNRKITPAQMYEMYKAGDNQLVFEIADKIPVKDTLFRSRTDFVLDSLAYIPFSGGKKIECQAIVKTVSGVQVPLFEAKMAYRDLLKGMDNQLRINLDADCKTKNRYEGLQVGSIDNPNNNAGNWE